MTETPLPAALTNAVAALWRIPPPGPNNLLSAPRLVHLRDTCESLYSNRRTYGLRVYLCPLGEADELPELRFGPRKKQAGGTAPAWPPSGGL
jgi:hypothetical protein